jgi:hypothetical protein
VSEQERVDSSLDISITPIVESGLEKLSCGVSLGCDRLADSIVFHPTYASPGVPMCESCVKWLLTGRRS